MLNLRAPYSALLKIFLLPFVLLSIDLIVIQILNNNLYSLVPVNLLACYSPIAVLGVFLIFSSFLIYLVLVSNLNITSCLLPLPLHPSFILSLFTVLRHLTVMLGFQPFPPFLLASSSLRDPYVPLPSHPLRVPSLSAYLLLGMAFFLLFLLYLLASSFIDPLCPPSFRGCTFPFFTRFW